MIRTKLQSYIDKNGTFPPVKLRIVPLDTSKRPIEQDSFLSYDFSSSILIPVDEFSFTFTNPTLKGSFRDYVQEGDQVELIVADQTVCTGTIDTMDIDTGEDGETVSLTGRDLLAQLEDQDAISINNEPIWLLSGTIRAAVAELIKRTKVKGLIIQDAPTAAYLFATEPGEKKITSLQRFCEPLNCIFWSNPTGSIVVGKPNMAQAPKGDWIMDRENGTSNVLRMKAQYSSTQIPNIILPIWSGQETIQTRINPEQILYNASSGPSRLLKLKYVVPRTIVVSNPDSSTAQGKSEVNNFKIAGGSNLLQAYAKREMARANINELIVQAIIPGHVNSNLEAVLPDTTYNIKYARASITQKMYLFSVRYKLDGEGQRTIMEFCKLGRIVADVSVNEKTPTKVKRSDLS